MKCAEYGTCCAVQDEILAEKEKFVLRVEDLVSWVSRSRRAPAARPPPSSPSDSDLRTSPPAECNLFVSVSSSHRHCYITIHFVRQFDYLRPRPSRGLFVCVSVSPHDISKPMQLGSLNLT